MVSMKSKTEYKDVAAIELSHNPHLPVYIFGADPKEFRDQLNINKITFDPTGKMTGYQRWISEAHVSAIRKYLETGMAHTTGAVVANSITVALKPKVVDEESTACKVEFTSSTSSAEKVRQGILKLPFQFYEENGEWQGLRDSEKSLGWVVDGQHRLEAFERYAYQGTMPIPFVAVIADDPLLQMELFLRQNFTLRIPTTLILRDLQRIRVPIPGKEMDQLCMQIIQRLESRPESPFRGMIQRV